MERLLKLSVFQFCLNIINEKKLGEKMNKYVMGVRYEFKECR